MDKLKLLMSKKVAGIPVLYIAALVVAILAVVAWRMKPAAAPADDPGAEADAAAEDGTGGDASTETPPVYVSNPSSPSAPIPDPNAEPTVDDNEKWKRRSIEWLATQGVTAYTATEAIRKYLAGEQMSQAEGVLRDKAIAHFGLPPEIPDQGGTDDPVVDPPVVTPPVVTPPVVTPPAKKYIAPGYHTVTGSADDSYTDIARLWYGRTDNASIDLIQSYNVTKPHAGPFAKGTRFYIPPYHAPKYVTATKSMNTSTQFIAKNPPLNSLKMLLELNDGMKFPVKVGTRVRVG